MCLCMWIYVSMHVLIITFNSSRPYRHIAYIIILDYRGTFLNNNDIYTQIYI